MFRFFLKKNFCDIWDNLFHTIIVNLMNDAVFAIAGFICVMSVYIPGGELSLNIYSFLALLISTVLISIFTFAEGENAVKITNFDSPKIKNLFKNIVPCIKDGALFGLFIAFLICVAFTSIPFYFRMGNVFGIFMMSIVFWIVLITILSLQWFLPVRSIMHNNFFKCLKKCYIIFMDNILFTIGVGLVNLVNIFVMIFSLGILNGPATMTITTTDALRLRLYKYDWYEVNPDLTKEQRADVPWKELLEKDRRILGPRGWKSFIFPWKE
ncbi:MAG: hypothetical protein K6G00_13005 [Treponema sp.]|nr:hypothetical protein [Treponema sp.]